jgi:hypothetical protein
MPQNAPPLRANSLLSQVEHTPQVDTNGLSVQRFPDRVTLMPPRWGRYAYPPFRPTHNLSPEDFDVQVRREVDDLLLQFRAERRLEQLFPESPLQRILTQDDALALFRVTGIPTSGSLYGVYLWAVGWNRARYNFEHEDDGNYDFLNAYCP